MKDFKTNGPSGCSIGRKMGGLCWLVNFMYDLNWWGERRKETSGEGGMTVKLVGEEEPVRRRLGPARWLSAGVRRFGRTKPSWQAVLEGKSPMS